MKKLFSLGVFSLLLLFIACDDDKKTEPDTTAPTFVEPLLEDTILAEANVPYDLKFGYLDNDKVATAKIEIEGEEPVTKEINDKDGIATIPVTFSVVGEKKLKVTLTDASGNTFIYDKPVVKVGAQGMNWLANGELVPDADWKKFPSWSTAPPENGDKGWEPTTKNNTDEPNPEYIAFFGSTGDPDWTPVFYTANITQTIVSLPNGTYTLSIRYSCGRNENNFGTYDPSTIQLKAEGFGEADLVLDLPKTQINADETDEFEIRSNEIIVTKGTCKVGVYVNASDAKGLGNYASIDYFRLIRKQ